MEPDQFEVCFDEELLAKELFLTAINDRTEDDWEIQVINQVYYRDQAKKLLRVMHTIMSIKRT